jgi:hypothetical protein
MLWYIRESSTAVYVSNLPMLWPLFRRIFKLGTFADRSGGGSNNYPNRGGSMPLSNVSKKKSTLTTSFTGSEERINKGEVHLEIEQRFSFAIEESSVPGVPRKSEYDPESLSGGSAGSIKGSYESHRHVGNKGQNTTTITANKGGPGSN